MKLVVVLLEVVVAVLAVLVGLWRSERSPVAVVAAAPGNFR